MAKLINLKSFQDTRGDLTVIEDEIGFMIKRVYYIYNTNTKPRAGHRHKKTTQALIALNGECSIYINNGKLKNTYQLNEPSQCLILEPKDWHLMENFKNNCILLVLASELYDINDYIDDEYV